MDPMLPYIVLSGGLVASRFLSESALTSLSPDQKVALIDAFGPLRKYGLLIILVAFIATYQYPLAFLGLLGLYTVVNLVVTFVQLRRLDVPPRYRTKTWLAQGVLVASLVLFLYLLWGIGA